MLQPELNGTPPAINAGHRFVPDHQEGSDQAHVDHRLDAVLRPAQQMIVREVLLDKPEEQLNRPARLVEVADLLEREAAHLRLIGKQRQIGHKRDWLPFLCAIVKAYGVDDNQRHRPQSLSQTQRVI